MVEAYREENARGRVPKFSDYRVPTFTSGTSKKILEMSLLIRGKVTGKYLSKSIKIFN